MISILLKEKIGKFEEANEFWRGPSLEKWDGRTVLYTENSHQIKRKSDCIYHFLIDLDPNSLPFGTKSFFLYNLISVWFKIFLWCTTAVLCTCTGTTSTENVHGYKISVLMHGNKNMQESRIKTNNTHKKSILITKIYFLLYTHREMYNDMNKKKHEIFRLAILDK